MDTVTTTRINKVKYYHGDELMKCNPELFKGCRNSRAIIEKQELDNTHYVFAKNTNGKWIK